MSNRTPVVLRVVVGLSVGAGVVLLCVGRDEPRPAMVPAVVREVPESGYADAVALALEQERLARGRPSSFELVARDEDSLDDANAQGRLDEPESDEEWQQLRRGGWNVTRFMVAAGHAARPSKLFRHKSLNPRDRYLSPAQRRELAEVMRPYRDGIQGVLNERHRITSKEMSELVAKGAVASTDLNGKPFRSSELPKESGSYNVFRRSGGRVFMANSDNMPGSALAESLMHVRGGELAQVVVAWFYEQGCLTMAEATALFERLAQPVQWNGR